MTENELDAAALLHAVEKTQSTVRDITRRGGSFDFMAVLCAQAIGEFADPRRLHFSAPRMALGIASAVLLAVFSLQFIRRRHNLGDRVGAPTLVVVAMVFLGNVAAFHLTHGGARGAVQDLVLGVAMLGLGVMYRRASMVLFGGAMVLVAPSEVHGWPVAAWLVPLLIWIAAVSFVGRDQLREQIKR